MPRRPRDRSRNRYNRPSRYEYWLNWHPETNEEYERANREIEILEELTQLNAEDPFFNNNNIQATEQKAALARMVLPHEGISLKEEIIAASAHPGKIEKELERQGATVNTATTEQLNAALAMMQEGGPVVESTGVGPRPTRRQNRNRRYQNPLFTMRKHWKARNIRRGPQFKLGTEFNEHRRIESQKAELQRELNHLRSLRGGKRTRRNMRLF